MMQKDSFKSAEPSIGLIFLAHQTDRDLRGIRKKAQHLFVVQQHG